MDAKILAKHIFKLINIRKIILKNKKTFEYFLVAVMLYIALYIAFLVKS